MTEATSRRVVLLAAAGLGAVGMAAAARSEQKGAASKATEIVLPRHPSGRKRVPRRAVSAPKRASPSSVDRMR